MDEIAGRHGIMEEVIDGVVVDMVYVQGDASMSMSLAQELFD
jgi:hypothetical protein